MSRQVLLVEDEPNIRDTLRFNLTREGYTVREARTAEEALRSFRSTPPDIMLLDVMLPGMSGFEVCRIIRQESVVPIIMLTAKDQELDKVLGLGVGADDYITKPFGLQELFARMTAVLRRADKERPGSGEQVPELDQVGGLVMDRAARTVSLEGEEV
ncbi:MAG: response regulator, partial [Candidatus Dormiibacterota bacterium]